MATTAQVSKAFRRYQYAAWAVGVFLGFMTLALLWFGLIQGYGWGYDATWFVMGWQVHGFLFMVYLVATTDVGVKARWNVLKLAFVAVLGTVPFAPFFVERRLHRDIA